MTVSQDILRTGLAVQSANLAFSNLRKRKKKKLVEQGITNLFGTAIIKEQADIIEGLD